jgi:RNA polymerase sigma factor (sigma-70 family)
MQEIRGQGAARWLDARTVATCDDALARFFRHKTNPHDFEDLKQQVWEELCKRPPEALRKDLRSYLFGIARFVLFKYFRRKNGAAWDPLTTSMFDMDPRLAMEATQVFGSQSFRSMLMRLGIDDQMLLELRYEYDLQTNELATVFDVPEGTIKSRLHNARKKLKALLDGAR